MLKAEAMWSQDPAATLHRRYLTALVCVAMLIVLDRFRIQPELTQLASDAPVMNTAGRQRMLSQNLAKTAVILVHETDPVARERRREELGHIVANWTRAQIGLQFGDAERNLPASRSPAAKLAFARIEPHFQAMREAALVLVEQNPSETVSQQQLEIILRHEPQFLVKMHELVGMLESDTRRRVRELEGSSWSIAAGILATMWILLIFAIRPARQTLERQVAETRDQYEAVVQSINEGLLLLDHQGRIQFANRQFCNLVQDSAENLAGLVAATLFEGPIGHLWPLPFPTETTVANAPCELELLSRDQTRHLCWVAPYRLSSDESRAYGWVILVMDITEQRQAERRTQAMADQLAHADRLKSMGEIAAGLAHEMHQPLGAIANFAEGCLARLQAGSGTARDLEPALQRILAAALRAGGIIRRVKQFSKNSPHTVAPADVHSLIREALELYTAELQRKSIIRQLDLQATSSTLPCDALQISQVLTNLIQNAIQAMDNVPTTDRQLSVETRNDDNAHLIICVSDTGPGISPELMSRLFESFSTTRPEGLGLGLSIVKSIIQAHSGEITAENRETGGAVMTITLPLQAPANGERLITGAQVDSAKVTSG